MFSCSVFFPDLVYVPNLADMTIPFRNTGLVALVIGALLSCSKSGTPDQGDLVNGPWVWVSTDGGIANQIHETPASTGRNVTLVLDTDGKYSITENGIVVSQGTYIMKDATCIHNMQTKKIIDFSSPTDGDMMVEVISGNRLVLSDEANDGTSSTYSR